MSARLYRVILPVRAIDRAVAFYRGLLATDGRRVSPGRHYFDCGDVVLAVYDPQADGDPDEARPHQGHIYFAVADLTAYHTRATDLGGLDPELGRITTHPWGERSFYMNDPFGNPLCFVDEKTVFTGR